MSLTTATRRSLLVGGAATLGLSACGSEQADTHRTSTHQVTLRGKLGSTELTDVPTRLVTLGIGPDTNIALSLGVTPVAIARDSNVEGGIEPWTRTALDDARPTLIDASAGIPVEKVAAAKPDLIVATTDYQLAKSYDQLTEIAPVLGYTSGPNTDRWQNTVTRLGTALDRPAKAKNVIAGVEAAVHRLRAAHPELEGKAFTFGPVQADGTIYTVNSATDLSAALLGQLGLKLSDAVTSLKPSSTPGKSVVSPERLDLLDADLLILTYVDTAQRAKLESNPLFQKLSAVKKGHYVAIPFPVAIAAAFPDPLTVPFALRSMAPKLAAALA
ncbi:MAG: ABC transporter substrate-binding protein [Nocardioides sp.]|uniref:ABC transporter substrate-binding protein n=1 Tax=Nocardioides sp. TaxID=35761 RepID=UPI0039E5BBC8